MIIFIEEKVIPVKNYRVCLYERKISLKEK